MSPTKRPIPGMAGNIGMLSSDIADSRKALKVLKKERKDFQEKQAGTPQKKKTQVVMMIPSYSNYKL